MTKKLPLLLSVPHAGLVVPPEVESLCILSRDQIIKDGDEGAAEIYKLQDEVADFKTTEIARAFVDLNRAEDDRRDDGIVKTVTIWNEPIYSEALPEELVSQLIEQYYRPYHQCLDEINDGMVKLCVDCHTMASAGPPIGPDTGKVRPHVCLGDASGQTLPDGWMNALAESFRDSFGDSVTINDPFSGGFITRHHGQRRPWVQLEISRAEFLPNEEKRRRVLEALRSFCLRTF